MDDLFPSDQFKVCGFSMSYRYDRDLMGAGRYGCNPTCFDSHDT